jgi:transposase
MKAIYCRPLRAWQLDLSGRTQQNPGNDSAFPKNETQQSAYLRHFKARLSSGKLEATNNIIKSIIRRSFGFRSTDNLISMIYLRTAPWLANLEDCLFNAIG